MSIRVPTSRAMLLSEYRSRLVGVVKCILSVILKDDVDINHSMLNVRDVYMMRMIPVIGGDTIDVSLDRLTHIVGVVMDSLLQPVGDLVSSSTGDISSTSDTQLRDEVWMKYPYIDPLVAYIGDNDVRRIDIIDGGVIGSVYMSEVDLSSRIRSLKSSRHLAVTTSRHAVDDEMVIDIASKWMMEVVYSEPGLIILKDDNDLPSSVDCGLWLQMARQSVAAGESPRWVFSSPLDRPGVNSVRDLDKLDDSPVNVGVISTFTGVDASQLIAKSMLMAKKSYASLSLIHPELKGYIVEVEVHRDLSVSAPFEHRDQAADYWSIMRAECNRLDIYTARSCDSVLEAISLRDRVFSIDPNYYGVVVSGESTGIQVVHLSGVGIPKGIYGDVDDGERIVKEMGLEVENGSVIVERSQRDILLTLLGYDTL